MSKYRLYTVTVTNEYVVLAESREDAEEVAEREVESETPDITVTKFKHYPGNYGPESIPYGHRDPSDPDRTIGEWISSGALDTSEG